MQEAAGGFILEASLRVKYPAESEASGSRERAQRLVAFMD